MREKHKLTDEIAKRYRSSKTEQKRRTLDEFVALTGYNRKYAIHLLSRWGKSTLVRIDNELIKLKAGRGKKHGKAGRLIYGHELDKPLEKLWALYDYPSGKRLAPAIQENLEILIKSKLLGIDAATLEALSRMSPATMDRRLAARKRAMLGKGISHTKPAKALKYLVPVRCSADWKEALPGEFQADTVGHDGGLAKGDYCFSLVALDVRSGWTELRALRNKARKWVIEAFEDIWNTLPFPFVALHTDNGSEFINIALHAACSRRGYAFTRSRAEKKNDNCYVECRNDDAVRRSVGYVRIESEAELAALAEIYRYACPLFNYFYPTMRMKEKQREGGKVVKRYDEPRSPYARLLEAPSIPAEAKERLKAIHASLDIVELKLAYDAALIRLESLVMAKHSRSEPESLTAQG